MNFTHLKYAVEVDKTGSISKAAENLFMSQPNLSKAIKELENELGFSVFTRTSKGIITTTKGSEFISRAHAILVQVSEMERLYTPDTDFGKKITVSIPEAEDYISSALAGAVNDLNLTETTEIRITEDNTAETISKVANGEITFGIIRFNNKQKVIARYETCIVTSVNNPLAKYKIITSEDLAQQIEVKKISENDFNKGKGRQILAEGGILNYISSGNNLFMHSSPLSQKTIDSFGLAAKKYSGGVTYTDALIYKSYSYFDETEKRFVEYVIKNIT